MNHVEWKERERMYACWLCNFPGISNSQMHRLLELCGSPETLYLAGKDKWGQVLSPKQVRSLVEYTAKWQPETEYRKMREEGIELVTMADEEYPRRLRNIPDAPYGLFLRGKLLKDDAPSVALIGARECSEYGKYVARQLGAALGRRGVTVISGMARGIDGMGQEAAMETGGYSIGVLGSGVDVCYPAQNRDIYTKLTKTGAILSTYPLGTPARPQNFPPRNRIVSGLADAVVVVEARVKSGTLITVDMALEQGREVYVVPGRVTDRLSDGCNRLIKQGAGVLLSPESFLEEIWQLWQEGKRRISDGGAQIPKGIVQIPENTAQAQEGTAQIQEGTEQALESTAQAQKGIAPRKEMMAVQKEHRTKGKKSTLKEERSESLEPSESMGFSELPAFFRQQPVVEGLELAKLYKALDFYPRSLEEIRQNLPEEYSNRQIVAGLMQLCMENLAVQMSPGYFCSKKP